MRRSFQIKIIRWIVLFAVYLLAANFVFASTFNIDLLNLAERSPSMTRAYFKISIKEAWEQINNSTASLSSVKIGILDSGIDAIHPEFAGINFGNSPSEALVDLGDEVGGELLSHGTNVAGIIGANNISAISSDNYVFPQMNGILSGAKNLNYILESRVSENIRARVLFDALAEISSLVKSDVDVVNISLESFRLNPFTAFMNIFFSRRFNYNSDILFVLAAGNDNRDAEYYMPANLGDNLDNVITVAATDLSDNRWVTAESASNFGSAVSLSAPGEQVYTPTFFTSPLDPTDYVPNFTDTSAAAPMVTGVAGLIKAIKPDLTPAQIKQILIETGDPISTDKPIGPRLNAYKAVCHPLVLNCAPPAFPTIPPFTQITQTVEPDSAASTTPSISEDRKKIVFNPNVDFTGENPEKNFEIFLADLNQQKVIQLTKSPFRVKGNIFPRISGNGEKVIFVSNHDYVGTNQDGFYEIFLVDVDTKQILQITNTPNEDFGFWGTDFFSLKINYNGAKIIFSSGINHTGKNPDRNSEIFLYDVSSKTLVQITDTQGGDPINGGNKDPQINGDGTKIVFRSDRNLTDQNLNFVFQVFFYDIQTHQTTQISPQTAGAGAHSGIDASIDKNGTKIVYKNLVNWSISLYDVQTTITDTILPITFGFAATPLITPNGNQIIVQGWDNFTGQNPVILNLELFLVDISTKSITQLTNTTPPVYIDGFSVANNAVAFLSQANFVNANPDGNFEVFLREF